MDYITCKQDDKETLDCRKRSLIYEKICEACNPREGNHKNNSWEELRDTRVGVSPASMWVKRLPHAQALNHEREGDPRFRFTIIKFYTSVLDRQVGKPPGS